MGELLGCWLGPAAGGYLRQYISQVTLYLNEQKFFFNKRQLF
ncbi:hypothetical protein DESPIG_02847 [Desulfovibrio piger ATCC 29098]|uniref:Uncharacterized protein n=1 Tax=Desulfovibrio piger ATCC 29098 TaxID=411464 RepID=B6WXM1_9BACT|nr:hypothetical protein DESPIG_02847 [Desulfovibrio piger ATCC 29098]